MIHERKNRNKIYNKLNGNLLNKLKQFMCNILQRTLNIKF